LTDVDATHGFSVGEEFAKMEGGISYNQVQAATPNSINVISDPPRVLDLI
jgi:hypothetical protein